MKFMFCYDELICTKSKHKKLFFFPDSIIQYLTKTKNKVFVLLRSNGTWFCFSLGIGSDTLQNAI